MGSGKSDDTNLERGQRFRDKKKLAKIALEAMDTVPKPKLTRVSKPKIRPVVVKSKGKNGRPRKKPEPEPVGETTVFVKMSRYSDGITYIPRNYG